MVDISRTSTAAAVDVHRTTTASPAAVWEVLANGWYYPTWVVGAARIRAVSSHWPGVGAVLHHSVGAWPLLINDRTEVLSSEPERELVLLASVAPMGRAPVHLRLAPTAGGGCEITMAEDVAEGPARLIPGPVRQALIAPRNAETLRRLCYIAERRSE
ncbi:SRPBCC family protein [Pseudonocardia acidicola]|uniref:SRPBCC family protein n=1 Tax=Pseudonocardia acidicola TaxID=2724939 RepID=A0ABX1SJK1_9PSEU|nr:SRPBCC family protein [Pseudonocardia acidicola]NMI01028.1 SRPBCC family protein [Pseudonocardia acidicola]